MGREVPEHPSLYLVEFVGLRRLGPDRGFACDQ